MIRLPDVNVLVAIAWPEHVLHQSAVRWLDANADEGWATCPVTESGFIRVSCNASAVGDAVRPVEAVALLAELRSVGRHQFQVDDVAASVDGDFAASICTGHRQITDAHLLALASRSGFTLSTFDRGVVEFARAVTRTKSAGVPPVELIERKD
jgi:uncharacterized protein